MDVAGAGEYLNLGRRSIFRMIAAGVLHPVRLPGVRALRFDLVDLAQLVESSRG